MGFFHLIVTALGLHKSHNINPITPPNHEQWIFPLHHFIKGQADNKVVKYLYCNITIPVKFVKLHSFTLFL